MSRRSFRAIGEARAYARVELDMLPPGASVVFEVDGETFRAAKAANGESWHLRSRRPLHTGFLSGRPLRRAYVCGTEPTDDGASR